MELCIKQLKQGSQIIVPQTTAEAVLVKTNNGVLRLDQVLETKSNTIIIPENSGLTSYKQNNNIIITHSNNIEPKNNIKPLMISYDSNGHITNSEELNPLKIIVNEEVHITHDGSEENSLKLGDDFTKDDENNIKLNWIEYGNA